MSNYSKLTPDQLASLDQLADKLKADSSFIHAIAHVLAKVVPVVVAVANVTVDAVGAPAVGGQTSTLDDSTKRVLRGELTAADLVALRNKLTK